MKKSKNWHASFGGKIEIVRSFKNSYGHLKLRQNNKLYEIFSSIIISFKNQNKDNFESVSFKTISTKFLYLYNVNKSFKFEI